MKVLRVISIGVAGCALAGAAAAQGEVTYRLRYGGSARVGVEITLPKVEKAPRVLVMPRAVPMGYGQHMYDQFVENVSGYGGDGAVLKVERLEGPRWRIGESGASVQRVEYEVDVQRMEREILSGGDSSRARENYLYVLGYSVFGYVEGYERGVAIRLEVEAPEGWPVFTTLAPQFPVAIRKTPAAAADFYALADSQVVMGRSAHFERLLLDGAPPLLMVTRAEFEVDRTGVAVLATTAYKQLVKYFGGKAAEHYTVVFEFLNPVTERHTYGFSMEHLESATFCLGKDRALTAQSSEREISFFRVNVAHHMAHAWIPKRAYGQGYFPFSWEVAPAHDSIWFSEGFGQYAAIDALADGLPEADRAAQLDRYIEARFRANLRQMPAFLLEMPLEQLSYRGSYVYSEDFRVGRTLFSRGGLMAAEMDARIRERTKGAKRLRDALRHLVAWSAKNKRGFEIRELPGIFEEATGVDTREILEKWLKGRG